MNDNNNKIKKKQQRNLMIVIAILILVFWGSYELISDKTATDQTALKEPANFASPLKHVDAESVILERTEEKLMESQKKTETLQQQLDELVKNNLEQQKSTTANKDQYQNLQKHLDELENKIGLKGGGNPDFLNGLLTPAAGGTAQLMGREIKTDEIVLALPKTAETVPDKNPDNYVAAGTFVKAVMLGGADASAAVNAQANPTPMLFRIIENGTMPNKKHSQLKDCVATAAVVGDISSERGMVRLETLSCVDPVNQKISDIAVEGTVFGPEGKNGIRGIPVWREGALLQRAFIAGTLSGFSNSVSQKYTTTSISPLGSTQTVSGSDILKYGAASGLGNAMDKLATYNIQRAEQYHPVLQLNAGTVVDLVFLKGFYLRENTPATTSKISELTNSRNIIAQSELAKLPLTMKQVEQLKTHADELGIRN